MTRARRPAPTEAQKPTLEEHLAGMKRADLEKAAAALVSFTMFAVANLRASGAGMVLSPDGVVRSWQDDGLDALELAGVWKRNPEPGPAKRAGRR